MKDHLRDSCQSVESYFTNQMSKTLNRNRALPPLCVQYKKIRSSPEHRIFLPRSHEIRKQVLTAKLEKDSNEKHSEVWRVNFSN